MSLGGAGARERPKSRGGQQRRSVRKRRFFAREKFLGHSVSQSVRDDVASAVRARDSRVGSNLTRRADNAIRPRSVLLRFM